MNQIGIKITNPYHEKYPEISRTFSALREKTSIPVYGILIALFWLHVLPLCIYFGAIGWVFVTRDIQIQNIEFSLLFYTSAGCILLFFGLNELLVFLRKQVIKYIKTGLELTLVEELSKIPESFWVELTILLRDLAKSDHYMSSDPINPHKKICHQLALDLLSSQNLNSKLNAIEYLFADYPHTSCDWPNPFSSAQTVKETYCGYLTQVLRRKMSEDFKKAMILKNIQAEEKLANLSQSGYLLGKKL